MENCIPIPGNQGQGIAEPKNNSTTGLMEYRTQKDLPLPREGSEAVGRLSERTWRFIQDFQRSIAYAGNKNFHKLLSISKKSLLKFTKLKINCPFMFC